MADVEFRIFHAVRSVKHLHLNAFINKHAPNLHIITGSIEDVQRKEKS